ncbi:TadE/TadG family type IV pilus assembly protein [Oceanirhabdus sp. W0125-5]|uniref:TadE/TadG family type IV pilus assembly protein n=1 Tax=Oceanirhabdus sp. W0125-5 TaxID=2999116 RepID=UPI0022F2E669|nr:TadE/TadG family type IV pilus assembly protein [Oceanirhabdus sp. W0125-5]WBW95953.1 pilus assembly protein [Oceanirhabdus sp. W0125-5]
MNLIIRLKKDQRGIAAAFFAVMMLIFMALAGVIIDGGLMMVKKIQLTSASEAAILSITKTYDKDLWEQEGKVHLDPIMAEENVIKLLQENMREAELIEFKIDSVNHNSGWIKTKAECEMVFMQIFGIKKKTIYVNYDITVGE